MKIPPITSQGMVAAYHKNSMEPITPSRAGMKADTVEISAEAASFCMVFKEVMQAVAKDTSSDSAKLEKVAKAIAADTYHVPSSEIASSMLLGVRLDKEV